jgi:hypothetical protein
MAGIGARLVVATVLLSAGILAACGVTTLSENQFIDGWSVGDASPCTRGPELCDLLLATALEGFNERNPLHPPVVDAAFHAEGLYRDSHGNLERVYRSGGTISVVVFRLADGSYRAIGVGWAGVGHPPEPPQAFDGLSREQLDELLE